MYYNPSQKSLGKPPTNIIIVMQNIGFASSADSTISTPENLGATIEKTDH